ncbi:MAG: NAD(P)-dependent oxidoreductase [Pirellulaceae bacterium]|nr:NAD(P)-dependent oxidoreductase [Pirellulaceae bacterium]
MIELKGRRIVLIGGAGFIGHNLALALKAAHAEVSIVDSLQVNNLLAFADSAGEQLENQELYFRIVNERLQLLREAGIPLYIQDARDYNALTKLLVKLEPQVIVQLAAVAHAGRSNKDPYSTFDHSLRTLENALDNARSPGVDHFIYFSSSMVYGDFDGAAVDESSPCEPLGIYGALKFAGEKMVIAYNQVFDLPYTIVRPSALYGERCVSRRVGQIFIENALDGGEVTIHGDGSEQLDFTYINDLIDGITRIIANEQSHNEIFNLTYGASQSVGDMANLLCEEFPDVTITYHDRDRLMPRRGTLKIDKARELLGYEPSWPLESGFPEYIRWYKEFVS